MSTAFKYWLLWMWWFCLYGINHRNGTAHQPTSFHLGQTITLLLPSLWDQCVGCFTSPTSLTRGGERNDMITWTAEVDVDHTNNMMSSVILALIINPAWGMGPGMVTLLCDFTAAVSKRSHYLHFAALHNWLAIAFKSFWHGVQHKRVYIDWFFYLRITWPSINIRLSACRSRSLSVPLSLFHSIFTPSTASS